MTLEKQQKQLKNCGTRKTDRYYLMAFIFVVYFCDFELIYVFYCSWTISSPRAIRPTGRPKTKKAIEIINMAEAIVDEVVTKLLTEAAEKVLKEEE